MHQVMYILVGCPVSRGYPLPASGYPTRKKAGYPTNMNIYIMYKKITFWARLLLQR